MEIVKCNEQNYYDVQTTVNTSLFARWLSRLARGLLVNVTEITAVCHNLHVIV